MRILVVAATAAEIAPFVAGLCPGADGDSRMQSYTRGRHDVDVLTTGVGMVATAAWCSRMLSARSYQLALNFGLCGSFDAALSLGTVVHVVSDVVTEMGAEDGEQFLTIQQLQLLQDDEFPYESGRLRTPGQPRNAAIASLPRVDGITVNTVHGRETSIAAAVGRFAPQVESMEGAAFVYCCLIHGVEFAQVRAVSNLVERRNRPAWKIAQAVGALGAVALDIIDRA